MTDKTSRRAFVSLAAGAAGVAAAAAGSLPASAAPASTDAAVQSAREAALRLSQVPQRHPGAVTAEARVLLCRSWDSSVYLYVSERVKGFVAVRPEAMAIAASCQASDRRVAVQYWGHEPGFAGVGRFDGALLAVDVRDLPARPDATA